LWAGGASGKDRQLRLWGTKRRLASSGVPGEPNGKDSDEGCGDAEEDLKYTVQLHDVSVDMSTIAGRWLVICMIICV
jgi:hypothetical protein